MNIKVFVEGIPKGQPRPRAFARGGKARVYDPGTAEGWKGAIALAMKPHLPKQPYEGPLSVTIRHYMPRPKGHFRSGKNAALLKLDAPTEFTSKPDCDNLGKSCLDSLTMIGLWRDDAQVVDLTVTKEYADERAGAEIEVKSL